MIGWYLNFERIVVCPCFLVLLLINVLLFIVGRHKWTPLHACVIGWAEFSAVKLKNKNAIRALKHGERVLKANTAVKQPTSFRNKNKAAFAANLTETSFSTILSVLSQVGHDDHVRHHCSIS